MSNWNFEDMGDFADAAAAELMEFGHSRGNGIDLHRRIDGNLKTRQMLMGPEPL